MSDSLFDINYNNDKDTEKREIIKELFGKKFFNKLKGLNWPIESISISCEGGVSLPFLLNLSAGASAQILIPKTKDNKNFGEIKNQSEKILEQIEKNTVPTIIFIDNIERLHEGAWDLLKTIFKFQNYPNFIIVLAMNINKLKNYDNEQKYETIIQKYINIKYFNLKPSYNNFLLKYFKEIGWINDEKRSLIENILNHEIEGRVLTIRELENKFNIYKINQQKSFEEFLIIFYNFIWCNNELINKYIINKINLFVDNHKNLKFKLDDFWKKFKMRVEDQYNYIFSDADEQLIKVLNNNIVDIKKINENYFNSEFVNDFYKIKLTNGEFLNIFDAWYNVEFDYLSIIEDMKNDNIKLITNVTDQINILDNILDTIKKKIEDIDKKIKTEKTKLEKTNLSLNELINKQTNNPEEFSDNNEENKMVNLENRKGKQNKTIASLETRKESFEELSDKITNKINFNKKNLDKIIKKEEYSSYIEEVKVIKNNIENLEFKDTCIKIISNRFGKDAYENMNNNSFVFNLDSIENLMVYIY